MILLLENNYIGKLQHKQHNTRQWTVLVTQWSSMHISCHEL